MFLSRAFKVLLIAIVVFAFATVAYAYAATNILPASTYAGDGNVAISGITVTNVQYTIAFDTDPSETAYITVVTLTLAPAVPATTTIQIKLVATGTTWYTCTNSGTTTVACDTSTPGVTVTAADNLRVIAYDKLP